MTCSYFGGSVGCSYLNSQGPINCALIMEVFPNWVYTPFDPLYLSRSFKRRKDGQGFSPPFGFKLCVLDLL